MSKKLMKIGITGFSRNQFDKIESRKILRNVFEILSKKHSGKEVKIVSGYTNSGIPKIAYELADEFGFTTVGYSARQALNVRSGVYSVKEVILIGEKFGEESESFVEYIDGLIRVGGGSQSRKEVELFKAKNIGRPIGALLKEYEVDWYGKKISGEEIKTELHPKTDLWQKIKGLQVIDDFVSVRDHDKLLESIDNQIWSSELKRRVQHYGYKYNYRSRSIDQTMRVGALPFWVNNLKEKIVIEGLMVKQPDQLIVNEYLPGQGISNHVDCEPCFGEVIISVSLGSRVVMNFTSINTKEIIPIVLEPRSAVILSGESRYKWMHGIIGRKSDLIENQRIARLRRVSLTFRKVILKEQGI